MERMRSEPYCNVSIERYYELQPKLFCYIFREFLADLVE